MTIHGAKRMSAIQWEYEIVEKPFCEQLAAMQWELTEAMAHDLGRHRGPESNPQASKSRS